MTFFVFVMAFFVFVMIAVVVTFVITVHQDMKGDARREGDAVFTFGFDVECDEGDTFFVMLIIFAHHLKHRVKFCSIE